MMFHRGHPSFQGTLQQLDAFKETFLHTAEKRLLTYVRRSSESYLSVIGCEIDPDVVNRVQSNDGAHLCPLLTKP